MRQTHVHGKSAARFSPAHGAFLQTAPRPWPRHKTSNCRSQSHPPAERRIPASAEPPIQPVPSGGKRPARAAARPHSARQRGREGFRSTLPGAEGRKHRKQKTDLPAAESRACPAVPVSSVLLPGPAWQEQITTPSKPEARRNSSVRKSSPFPNGKEVVKSKSCLMSASLFSRCRPPGLSHPAWEGSGGKTAFSYRHRK